MKTLKDFEFLTREQPPISFFGGAQSLVNALHAEGRVALMQLQEARELIERLQCEIDLIHGQQATKDFDGTVDWDEFTKLAEQFQPATGFRGLSKQTLISMINDPTASEGTRQAAKQLLEDRQRAPRTNEEVNYRSNDV